MTIAPKTSRGLRVLPPSKQADIVAEKDDLMKEIALIEQWWKEPRWKGTTRTFNGESSTVLWTLQCQPMYLPVLTCSYIHNLQPPM